MWLLALLFTVPVSGGGNATQGDADCLTTGPEPTAEVTAEPLS